ncbi:sensor histidine kinase [Rhodoferax ferrireducens]|nr:PAS domain-containing sensor histidine kinase [Rhodoferax ferrireducens]
MHIDTQQVLTPPNAAMEPVLQKQLALLLESTGEGIYGIDMEGRCTFINRAGANMIGREPEEVLGCNMHELTHHSHPGGQPYAAHDCAIFNAFRQGLPCRIDTEVFWHRDQHCFPVEYSSYPLMDGDTVLGAVITFVDITERKRAADALQLAKNELEQRVSERTQELSVALGQLRELSAYSENVREDERTRIAREVHDELGSLLVALKMDVNWMDKRLSEQQQRTPHEAEAMRTRLRSKCRNMSGLIERAVDNVGRIITDLRPSILDHQGLWAALEWQAHEFAQSAELALDWDMQGTDGVELPEPEAMAVFRIFQEMLSNVARHAQAMALTLRIQVEAEVLTISVQDNGCGANALAFEAPTAYGVMGMRERARHFGGQLEISSQIGLGSAFTLRLPLSKM